LEISAKGEGEEEGQRQSEDDARPDLAEASPPRRQPFVGDDQRRQKRKRGDADRPASGFI
jgi:hypothetical protein